MIFEVLVDDFLFFEHGLKNIPRQEDVSSFLLFTEKVGVSPIRIEVVQTFFIGQTAKAQNAIRNIGVTQNLHFETFTAKGPYVSVVDFFFMTDDIEIYEYDSVSHTLVFTESIVADIAKPASNTLVFTQSATYNIIRSISVVDTFQMSPFASGYMEKCDFIATGEVALTSPYTISLSFGSTTIVLRNPDFGEGQGFEASRINRKTRAGDILIFRDPSWPKSKILRYTFSHLNETQAHQLIDFVENTLGQEITLVDFEGRTWLGIIRTPATNIIQQARKSFSAEFEFEGDLV